MTTALPEMTAGLTVVPVDRARRLAVVALD
jgi:hypothetical protein